MDARDKEIRRLQQQMESLTDRLQKLGEETVEELGTSGLQYLENAQEYMEQASETLREKGRAIKEKAQEASKKTDTYVRENPWQVAGMAVLVGVALGMLMHKNKDR